MPKLKIQNQKNTKTLNSTLSAVRGFTLIETLIAITVLVTAVVAPLEIASKALFSAFYARDEIIAFYLADEGIEYIKNARDTMFLNDVFDASGNPNQDWLKGLDECIVSNTNVGCIVRIDQLFMLSDGSLNADAIEECGSSCSSLKFKEPTSSSAGFYGYVSSGGVITASDKDSKFKRTVSIKKQANRGFLEDELLIESKVEWPTLNIFTGNKQFTVKGTMSNWQRK